MTRDELPILGWITIVFGIVIFLLQPVISKYIFGLACGIFISYFVLEK